MELKNVKLSETQKILDSSVEKIASKINMDEDYENLFKGDKGLTELFVNTYKYSIKLINKEGDGYFWNPDTALWEEKPSSFFLTVITKFMESKVLFYTHKYSGSEEKNPERIIKLNKVLEKVRSVKQAENIFKGAKGLLYDPGFQGKLNVIPHLLPVKDNRVLDLKTLKCRPREIADLFDFEIDVEYDEDFYGMETMN